MDQTDQYDHKKTAESILEKLREKMEKGQVGYEEVKIGLGFAQVHATLATVAWQ